MIANCRLENVSVSIFAKATSGPKQLALVPNPGPRLSLLAVPSVMILRTPNQKTGLRMLPLVHATIAIEAGVYIAAAAHYLSDNRYG